MLLMLLNNLYRAHTEVCNGVWEREGNRGVEIKGKCIGIIGYGNMGQAFAQRLAGFEAKVLAYDKYKVAYGNPFAQEATLDDIFEQADILSIHLPLTPETLYMVDADFIQKFKKNIYFINTSRGKNLMTADLVSALKSGKVLGAALDVLEYESISFENLHKAQLPPDFEYLTQSTNVVLSPHIAGWTHESNTKLAYYTALKIIRTLQA
jgi:D-3-phosphoglycerate dehydrogenase